MFEEKKKKQQKINKKNEKEMPIFDISEILIEWILMGWCMGWSFHFYDCIVQV